MYEFGLHARNASYHILPSLEFPTLFIKEPRILEFERQTPIASDNKIESSWIINSKIYIPSLSYIGNAARFDIFCNDIQTFNDYVTLFSKKIVSCLNPFIAQRIPDQRGNLMPGRHWVWNFFSNKINKISALMIVSSHIISYEDMKLRSSDECLLSNRDCFKCYNNFNHDNDIDGNYIIYDQNRQVYIRSGIAASDLFRRWKDHVSTSMICTYYH